MAIPNKYGEWLDNNGKRMYSYGDTVYNNKMAALRGYESFSNKREITDAILRLSTVILKGISGGVIRRLPATVSLLFIFIAEIE